MDEGPEIHTIRDFLDGVRSGKLLGYRCEKCGYQQVTPMLYCPKCGGDVIKSVELKPTGTIESYTIIQVPPETHINDAPYAWVIVKLDEGPKVSGWIPFISKPGQIKIGDRVRYKRSYLPGIVFELIEKEK